MKYLDTDTLETRYTLLWYHKAGLQQTASGYGGKLVSPRMVRLPGEKRWRRVYVMQYSNAGTAYVLVKGERLVLR